MTSTPHSPNDRPLISISLMVGGMLIAPMGDTVAKLLSTTLPVVEIAWLRNMLQAALLFPFIHLLHRGWAFRLVSNIKILFVMGTLWILSTMAFYYSISKNPIPNTLAVFFVCPIAVMTLAPLFLGERFRLNQLMAVLISFLGVLLVLQPDRSFDPSILFALLGGICFGCYLMSLRKVSGRMSPLERSFGAGCMALILPFPVVLWLWEWPGWDLAVPLTVLGLTTVISHWLIALASDYADASVYAPFNYVEILSATLLSWIFFRTFPNLWAWVGILIIIGTGLYLMLMERKAAKVDQITLP